MVKQEEQIVQASRAREEGPKEPANSEAPRVSYGGAGRQAEAAVDRRGPVPALARCLDGDAQSS